MIIDTKPLRDLIHRASPLPWLLATSNSWRRIVDAKHAGVCTPCTQLDGYPDLQFAGGYKGANAQLLIEAVNALPVVLDTLDAQAEQLSAYPADWRKDSSLETWFPYSAEQLKVQALEIAEAGGQIEHLDRQNNALRDALRPFAEIDLTAPLPNDFAWFVLHARAALAQEQGESDGNPHH